MLLHFVKLHLNDDVVVDMHILFLPYLLYCCNFHNLKLVVEYDLNIPSKFILKKKEILNLNFHTFKKIKKYLKTK